MWRVVAVTGALVHRHGGPPMQHTFLRFIETPNREQFHHWASDESPSVESVVQEAIRLYPPTKKISRITNSSLQSPWGLSFITSFFSTSLAQTSLTSIADVAGLHRDVAIWGPNSSTFDPSRFHPSRVTDVQKQCLLGFGSGRLKCVAKDWAPHTAAVIAAAMLKVCSEGAIIVEGKEIGGRVGWDGWQVVPVGLSTST